MTDLNLKLTDINGKSQTLANLTMLFEPGFIFVPAGRDLGDFMPVVNEVYKTLGSASLVCSIVVTLPIEQTKEVTAQFKEDLHDIKIFVDPKGELAQSLGVTKLPSFVHLGINGIEVSKVQGWSIQSWQTALDKSAKYLKWTSPQLLGNRKLPKPFFTSIA
mgnify:CR=1 FL=1|jgi:hypothetical protein